jgi:hypothetical protein
MRKLPKSLAVAAVAAGLLAVGPTASAQIRPGGGLVGGPNCVTPNGRGALNVVGATADGRLICFSENNPASARTIGTVTGLSGDTALVGIDHRPANGELWGLGNAGGLYSVDAGSAVATKRSQVSVALEGSAFGIDFNPTVDRLRIVSDSGQNLRVNVETGAAIVDGTLTYTAPPAAPVTATGIIGAGYTNNDADASTATTLFDLDAGLDQVAIQAPPNNGGLNATGKVGVDVGSRGDLDIHSTIRNGATVAVTTLAAIESGGSSALYSVDVLTGRATNRGSFLGGTTVVGIAIPLNQL